MKPIARRIEILETELAPAEEMPSGLTDAEAVTWALVHGQVTLAELVEEVAILEVENANA